ncbi:hypothetical protein CFOL_v3_19642 [Cephalotus follicularis]|uniref:RVP_2 domain-containing protein n=1 Tax=Cephalotus follicularis TaxID=3775 RepID=A0A1Q3C7B3_CEPFO|nr:hypothetical protein CFOL_v3_19642 [Cephalotus follicularis]
MTAFGPNNRPMTDLVIFFSNTDFNGVQTPHGDAIVITLTVANFEVERVLIDNGSSAGILYHDVLEKLNLGSDRLKSVDSPLYGFLGEPIHVEGAIKLLVTVGIAPCQSTIMVKFLTLKLPSAYNMIIGRPSLNALGAIVLTFHMKLMFLASSGVGVACGDQKMAGQCYLTALRPKTNESLQIGISDLRFHH